MEIIPAIYILNGHCVSLYKGSHEQKSTYVRSPIQMAKYFAKEGAQKLHIIDLNTRHYTQKLQTGLLHKLILSINIPVQLEATFHSFDDIEQAFQLGISKISLRPFAFELISQAIQNYGPEKILIEIQARGGEVQMKEQQSPMPLSTNPGSAFVARPTSPLEPTPISSITSISSADSTSNSPTAPAPTPQTSAPEYPLQVIDFAEKLIPLGVKTIIYKDEQAEGTMIHPNYDEVDRLVTMPGQDLNIYVSGGIGQLKHLHMLKKIGATGAIISKAFFEGVFTVKEAMEAVF